MGSGAASNGAQVYITPEDDLVQMYTSGTTGRPKGAVLTQSSLAANIAQCTPTLRMDREQRTLIVAPLYHIAAAFCSFSSVYHGGSLFIYEDFNPVEVVRAIDEERISWALLVPSMIQACLVLCACAIRHGPTAVS